MFYWKNYFKNDGELDRKKLISKQWLKYLTTALILCIVSFMLLIVASPLLFIISLIGKYIFSLDDFWQSAMNYTMFLSIFAFVLFRFYQISSQSLYQTVIDSVPEGYAVEKIDIGHENNDVNIERIRKIFLKSKIKLGIGKDWPIELYRVKGYEMLNAFAISNIKKESFIVIYDGILGLENREIQAIIGHEIGHIINRDSLMFMLNSASQESINILSNISLKVLNASRNVVARVPFYGIVFFFSTLVLEMIIRLINFSLPIIEYISAFGRRHAEYIADYYGAKSSSSEDMINALKYFLTLDDNSPDTSSLLKLLSSHPPTEDRIKYLKAND